MAAPLIWYLQNGAFARLLFRLKLQNISDSGLLELQGNLRYNPSVIYPTAFPFSKGSYHHFRRSSSNKSSFSKHFPSCIWSMCKWIILNQSDCLRWQHLGVKWMDGVVKRRHREYASLYSLLNFTACSMTSFGHGSSEQLHSDNISWAHLETQSALDTGEHIHSRTQSTFHSITTSGMGNWHQNREIWIWNIVLGLGCRFIIAGVPTVTQFFGMLHISIQLVQMTKRDLVWTFHHAIAT